MVNYQLGKIYKIVDNTNENIYIGSTCEQYLSNRLGGHRTGYQRYINGKHNFVTAYEILKNDNYDIVLIESYPCDDKMQLHARERHYIETLECINKIHPTRTSKEYRNDNKNIINQNNQKYYNEHKDEILKKLKEYSKEIKEHKKEYREANKEAINAKGKEYREANKEAISEKRKENYKINNDAINDRRRALYKLKKEQQQNFNSINF